MAERGRRLLEGPALLWLLVGVGLLVRVAVGFHYYGIPDDIDSEALVYRLLHQAPLHVYALANPNGHDAFFHWPYPPALFAWILVAGSAAGHLGLPFHGVVKLAAILADTALALIVHRELTRQGRGATQALAGAALVALGPTFIANSAYHGQLDSLAILPSVVGYLVWTRGPSARRAVIAGLLIGLGGSIKSPAGLVLLALLPSCRSWSEAARLVGTALAVPLALLLPFFVTTPSAVVHSLTYSGVPGVGGLTLAVQPSWARVWLRTYQFGQPGAGRFVSTHGLVFSAFMLALIGGALWRWRPPPAAAATLVWVGFFALAPGFFFGYLIWCLPFWLLAGHLRAAAALMALVFVPTILLYAGPWRQDWPLVVYATLMVIVWLAFVVALVLILAGLSGRAGSTRFGASLRVRRLA